MEPPETAPPSDAPMTGEVPGRVLDAVRAELAALIGSDPSAATIVAAEAVEWPDGSLGCPEPGMMYTQAIVPGYHVVFELDGARYDFRVAESGVIRLCENPGPLGG